MKAYAGIGSRDITEKEQMHIGEIAYMLHELDYICYSGNANGSDISFQYGSGGKCVIFLPWARFNFKQFEPTIFNNISYHVVGNLSEGLESVDKFHPRPKSLSDAARKLMARNYYQINGLAGECPPVNFVICCANTDKRGNVMGGTGQAVRIAKSMDIPVFNIRTPDWRDELDNFLNPIF